MAWESFKEGFDYFSNSPLIITLVTVLSVVGCALLIFANSSLGKKALKELRKLFDKSEKEVKDYKDKVEKLIVEKEEQLKLVKETYEKQYLALYSKYEELSNYLIEVVELIPNKQVKDKALEIKEKLGETKQELNAKVEELVDKYELKVDNFKELAQEEIISLKKQIEELKGYVITLKEGIENEERIDNETKN